MNNSFINKGRILHPAHPSPDGNQAWHGGRLMFRPVVPLLEGACQEEIYSIAQPYLAQAVSSILSPPAGVTWDTVFVEGGNLHCFFGEAAAPSKMCCKAGTVDGGRSPNQDAVATARWIFQGSEYAVVCLADGVSQSMMGQYGAALAVIWGLKLAACWLTEGSRQPAGEAAEELGSWLAEELSACRISMDRLGNEVYDMLIGIAESDRLRVSAKKQAEARLLAHIMDNPHHESMCTTLLVAAASSEACSVAAFGDGLVFEITEKGELNTIWQPDCTEALACHLGRKTTPAEPAFSWRKQWDATVLQGMGLATDGIGKLDILRTVLAERPLQRVEPETLLRQVAVQLADHYAPEFLDNISLGWICAGGLTATQTGDARR